MPTIAQEPIPTLWRTKLRSTLDGVDHASQVQHCCERDLIGIGWGIDELDDGATLEEVCAAIKTRPWEGWGSRAAHTVRRFAEQAQIGDFVWTRDTSGRYLLARISGEYRYDISDTAKAVDVHQVRDVEWAPRPLNDLEVPGAVIRRFVGTGSSFSRINDDPARLLTPYLWEKLHDRPLPDLDVTPHAVLESHLDPYDVEDLVYIWLQVARGYVAMPSSRQRDTPAYEWTMIHRETRRKSIVQVKTGNDAVDLEALAKAGEGSIDTFAFSTRGQYFGSTESVTEIISSEDLLDLVASDPSLLPPRVLAMFELAA